MEEKLTKVSIIIPTFNDQETISKCLESILNQDEENIEVIVVNDGSTDSTLSIIEKYREKDKRIFIFNQKNSGSAIARNVGVKLAKSEYILFVDADDWIDNNYVSILLEKASNTKTDMVFCGMRLYEPNDNDLKTFKEEVTFSKSISDKELLHQYLIEMYINGSLHGPISKLYKTSIIKQNKILFPDFRRSQDILFNLDYIKHINSIEVINNTFYNIRLSNKRIKIKKKNDYKHLQALNNYFDLIIFLENKINGLLIYWHLYDKYIKEVNYTHFKMLVDHLLHLSSNKTKNIKKRIYQILNQELTLKIVNNVDIKIIRYKIIKRLMYKKRVLLLILMLKLQGLVNRIRRK